VNIEDSFATEVLRAWQGTLEITQLIDCASRLEANNLGPLAVVLYQTWINRTKSTYAHIAYFNLGVTLTKLEDVVEAEDAYREAIKITPGFLEPRINLGLLLERSGQIDKAISEWHWVEQNISPELPMAVLASNHLRRVEESKRLAELSKPKKYQERVTLISNGHPLHEISVKSLVGYLEAHGVPCRSVYLNCTTRMTVQQCQQVVDLCAGSILVGFSLMSKDIKMLLPIADALGTAGTPVIWGGIHPTAMPEESLAHCDFVCVGEGELTLFRLYQLLRGGNTDYSSIPNLAYKANGQAVLPLTFHSEPSLDALPFPDYEFSDAHMLSGDGNIHVIPFSPDMREKFLGWNSFLFYSQRGCPFSCTYCSNSLYHNIAKTTRVSWYRTVSPARVKEEIRHHLKFLKVQVLLWINDDDFIFRPLEEIEELGKFFRDELRLRFNINATPSAVTHEKVAALVKYGVYQICMGVQTGSPRILKDVYQRSVKPEQVIKAAQIIGDFYKDGIVVDYGFILENPYEQPEDLRDSIKLFMALPRPYSVSLYSLAFFPGTVLTKRALQEQVISKSDISMEKDYRTSIQPSFAHFLFEANYLFTLPKDFFDVLLCDATLKAEEATYVRLLLGNYFIGDAVWQIAGISQDQNQRESSEVIPTPEEKVTASFIRTVKEILENWAAPNEILTPSGTDEDLVLRYAVLPEGGNQSGRNVEIAFLKGRIVRFDDKRAVSTMPTSVLNNFYRERYFSTVLGT